MADDIRAMIDARRFNPRGTSVQFAQGRGAFLKSADAVLQAGDDYDPVLQDAGIDSDGDGASVKILCDVLKTVQDELGPEAVDSLVEDLQNDPQYADQVEQAVMELEAEGYCEGCDDGSGNDADGAAEEALENLGDDDVQMELDEDMRKSAGSQLPMLDLISMHRSGVPYGFVKAQNNRNAEVSAMSGHSNDKPADRKPVDKKDPEKKPTKKNPDKVRSRKKKATGVGQRTVKDPSNSAFAGPGGNAYEQETGFTDEIGDSNTYSNDPHSNTPTSRPGVSVHRPGTVHVPAPQQTGQAAPQPGPQQTNQTNQANPQPGPQQTGGTQPAAPGFNLRTPWGTDSQVNPGWFGQLIWNAIGRGATGWQGFKNNLYFKKRRIGNMYSGLRNAWNANREATAAQIRAEEQQPDAYHGGQ